MGATQPVQTLSPTATSASRSGQPRLRFQPNRQSVAAKIELGKNGLGLRFKDAVFIGLLMVSVVEAFPADRFTVCGEKLHETPAGSPEQLSETGEVNATCGVIMICTDALCPAVNAREAGLAAIVKLEIDGFAAELGEVVLAVLPLE